FAEGAELLRLVTGWDVKGDELRTTARRIVTAKKLFNMREGWTPAEDTLPARFLGQGLPLGAGKDATLPRQRLEEMVRAYWRARGWGEEGGVRAVLAERLGLSDLVAGGAAPPRQGNEGPRDQQAVTSRR